MFCGVLLWLLWTFLLYFCFSGIVSGVSFVVPRNLIQMSAVLFVSLLALFLLLYDCVSGMIKTGLWELWTSYGIFLPELCFLFAFISNCSYLLCILVLSV